MKFLRALLLLVGLVACGAKGPPVPDSALAVGSGDAGGATIASAATGFAPEDSAAIPIYADDAVLGQRLAFVTLVVFSDFQCPFCSKLEITLSRLHEEYGDELRVVFKNHPLPFHKHARLAAEIGQGVLALGGQEAFWRYHMNAFREQSAMTPETLTEWAVAAGVDANQLDEGLRTNRWAAKIDRDVRLADKLDAQGTPASFINGVLITGAQPYEKFKGAIDAALADARSLAQRGVPRDQIYARLAAANAHKSADDKDDDSDDKPTPSAEKTIYRVPAGMGPSRGPSTALVTVIEFSDFECQYCKKVEETLNRVRKEYGDKVRLVWRDLPLRYHQRAEPAAQLARAARAQKGDAAFWTVHDLLFASSPKLDEPDLQRIATEAKLDVQKAMASVKSSQFAKGIEIDVDDADDFQAASTPHFFINGRRLSGAKPFDAFKTVIDEELARAEALVRQGTARATLYDALTKDGKGPPEPERKKIADTPNAPFRGNANGKVVIHEIADFQCPFCKRAEATIDELMKLYPGKIKVIWRDKPLPMHPDAQLAAEAAREAYAQKGNEGFVKMHKLLFDNQQALKRDQLDGHARAIGLDMAKFAHALDTHAHKAVIDADVQAASDAGVHGTPGFIIGPYFLSGAQPLGRFKRLVERVLNPPPPSPSAPPPPSAPVGLVVKDVVVGQGAEVVKAGDALSVHYVGTLSDGTEFDSSRSRNQPFKFTIGKGQVIKGWEQGLLGMKVGGKRKLTIPPDLAYGDRRVGKIPSKSTLLFEIELLAIQ